MTPRLLPLALAAVLLCSCAARVAREDLATDDEVAGMPWVPGTEQAVRDWLQSHANLRDLSVDLSSPTPYVETALAEGSPVPRVGYFFRRDPWRVGAVLLWLSRIEQPPALGEPAGELWGMKLFATAHANERYAPAAHVLIRLVDPAYPLPARPQADLPRDVLIKTPTHTFHRDHLYALHDGRIFFKRNPAREGTLDEPWRLFGDGLPAPRGPDLPFHRPSRITALSADGDDLLALDDTGRVYLCTTESKSLTSANGWEDGWGFPGKRPLYVNGRAADPRALAIGRRAEHALWFEDAIGNRHHFGPMGTTTLYVLHGNGQEMLFTDNGLPNDFSRGLCGPDDGRFIAENLSASASALFLIDAYGRMVTRFDDYDLNGGTPNFEYTYRSEVRADDQGDAFLTSMTPYYLPLPPWRWHAPPRLSGQARLSRDITILQTGAGNSARELRVAGLDAEGRPGYFRKGIDEEEWVFVPSADVAVRPARLLDPEDVALGAAEYATTHGALERSQLPRGRTYRAEWTGTLQLLHDDRPDEPLKDVQVRMSWNPYCPPARLTFELDGVSFEAPLHTVDLWTPSQRVRPGFDGTPLLLLGTLVLDDAVLTDARPAVRRVTEHLRRFHHALFAFVVALDGDRVDIRAIDDPHPIALSFVQTGAWDPPEPPAAGLNAPQGSLKWLGSDLTELTGAKELIVDPQTATAAQLRAAIDENVRLRDELRAAVSAQEERLKETEEFRKSIRFAAPLLPLGRFRVLPRLLSIQSVRGRLAFMDAATTWRAADEVLTARISVYEDALSHRQ